MPGITSIFRRLGFVRVTDYGLILTPDDRVMSTRSLVLDDGLGGKIVGWREGDLAAMELEPVREAAAPKREIKAPVMAPPPPPMPRPAATVSPFAATIAIPVTPAPVLAAPVAAAAPIAAPRRLPGIATAPTPIVKPVPAPQPVPVSVVAPVPEPEEDEWEWEIAMARARAAAEWAEEAATGFTKPADPLKAGAWPQTEPLHEVWEATPAPLRTERVARITAAPKQRPEPITKLIKPPPAGEITTQFRPVSPRPAANTVIPVPALPTTADPRSIRPVIAAPRTPIAPPRRTPRATSRFEETIRTHAASPVNDDETSPNIALPPASAGKRVAAAKQR